MSSISARAFDGVFTGLLRAQPSRDGFDVDAFRPVARKHLGANRPDQYARAQKQAVRPLEKAQSTHAKLLSAHNSTPW